MDYESELSKKLDERRKAFVRSHTPSVKTGDKVMLTPVIAWPNTTPMSLAVGAVFARGDNVQVPSPIVTGYSETILNWKKPIFDAEGKCVGLRDA